MRSSASLTRSADYAGPALVVEVPTDGTHAQGSIPTLNRPLGTRYAGGMIRIRKASLGDAANLPDIERSASAIFRRIASLAWLAEHGVQSVGRHLEWIEQGTSWVASDCSDDPIGFLGAEIIDDGLHIWELAVRSERQGHGIGRALVDNVRMWALDNDIEAMTLTTFRELPWNELFYRSVGFRTLDRKEITPFLAGCLASEADAGLPIGARCAMVLTLR